MSTRYVPAWWLPDGHSMTLWARVFRPRHLVDARRERIATPDDDFVDIWRMADADADAPRVVVFHGLEGDHRSPYVAALMRGAQELGWGADAAVHRGCGGEMNRAPRYYFAGDSDAIDLVVSHVARSNPRAPLFVCGISLGANMVLKWLGERGALAPPTLVAAAAVSTPFDLARSSRRIETGVSRIYTWNFLRSMRPKAIAKIDQHPGIASREAVARARTIWDLDDAFTAPVHGFLGAQDYYSRSSSLAFLHAIRVPTLLLSARDDPFHPPGVLDEVTALAVENPALVLDFPPRGGHVGFVGGRWPWRATFYAEERVISFFHSRLRATGNVPAESAS
jgi:predicted alpha/beta-fold hydrolase